MVNETYKRFTYWMDKREFLEVQNRLIKQHIDLYETRKAICLALSNKVQIGYVAPYAWSNFDICRRQLSWYETSRFAGQYLVISKSDICNFGIDMKPSTIISKPFFRVKQMEKPNNEEIYKLAAKEKFQKLCPAVFKDIDSIGENSKSNWLKIMGIRGITYNELFVFHCANHSNFIDPEYFIEDADGAIPYSIGPTKQICSACLEFFNIIGENSKRKLVIPCPGAVLFAGMTVNHYYQVES